MSGNSRYVSETDCGPRPETDGPWQCAKCGRRFDRSVRARCPGAPPPARVAESPIGPCPIIGAECDQLCLNHVSHFCRRDLLAIEEPCGDVKRSKAVAAMAARAGGKGTPCPRQEAAW